MVERNNIFRDAKKYEDEDEEILSGEILPEVIRYSDGKKTPLVMASLERQSAPKDFEAKCKLLELLLSKEYSIEYLVSNQIVARQAFMVLWEEYENKRRSDRNNYKDKIKKYFNP